MKNEINFSDTLFFKNYGSIFGILSVSVGVIGDLIALYLFPGYSIFSNMISELGVGPGGIFFNIGVFFSGNFKDSISYIIRKLIF